MLVSNILKHQPLQSCFRSTFKNNGYYHRQISTASTKIAIIGSGPSAFYTSLDLLKKNDPNLQIDMFEKNPCPFGLVRYGVAPDHPEVKICEERFHDASKDTRFKFFGNVEIGKDLKLKELYDNYNVVVYAYGSLGENKLGIPGESDLPGVINSKDFVGWYNGDPKNKNLNPPLSKVKKVTIIGNGNVAIDIVRILLASPRDHWSGTDISEHALETLRNSSVENVTVSARKGFLESKFTNKEFKEVLELEKEGVLFGGWNGEEFRELLSQMKLSRIEKRRLQLAEKYDPKQQETPEGTKSWSLDYLKTPIGFRIDPNDPQLLKETIFKKHKIELSNDKTKLIIDESETKLTSNENQLVILSIGYKAEPLKEFKDLGIPFDKKRGLIPNIDGKIINPETNTFVPGSYCVGWIANGSKGNINSSVQSSSVLAETINDGLENSKNNKGEVEKQGRIKIEQLLSKMGKKVVDWDEWCKIEQVEKNIGEKKGKAADKISDFNEMLQICK